MMRKFIVLVIVLFAGFCWAQENKSSQITGYIKSKKLDEASGLVASRIHKNVLYSHNDSGDVARIFALKTDGMILAQYLLKDVKVRDVEEIAIGPGPVKGINYIFLADIGDNNAVHDNISVYRFPEPNVPSEPDESADARAKKQVDKLHLIEKFDTLKFIFPDGKRDAETMFVDPLNKDIWIVSKREKKSRVYVSRYPQLIKEINKLEFITELPFNFATAGDINSDGSIVLIKNYVLLARYDRQQGKSLDQAFKADPQYISIMPEPQGESVCFSADGKYYYTISEFIEKFHKKTGVPVYRFGLMDSKK
ncbi:MAG: hypothetical protein JEZ07_07500 [Phycisphaerae bacterium]|nr:hypothetical protein [Phycisphaerae bacterium]